MSSTSRKHRGYKTQSLIAEDLASGLFPYAVDAGPGRPGKDVLHTPGFSIEIKARTGFKPVEALRQATSNADEGELSIVICRMNGQGPTNIDSWVAFMTWGDCKKLMESRVNGRTINYENAYLCADCDELIDNGSNHKCGGDEVE